MRTSMEGRQLRFSTSLLGQLSTELAPPDCGLSSRPSTSANKAPTGHGTAEAHRAAPDRKPAMPREESILSHFAVVKKGAKSAQGGAAVVCAPNRWTRGTSSPSGKSPAAKLLARPSADSEADDGAGSPSLLTCSNGRRYIEISSRPPPHSPSAVTGPLLKRPRAVQPMPSPATLLVTGSKPGSGSKWAVAAPSAADGLAPSTLFSGHAHLLRLATTTAASAPTTHVTARPGNTHITPWEEDSLAEEDADCMDDAASKPRQQVQAPVHARVHTTSNSVAHMQSCSVPRYSPRELHANMQHGAAGRGAHCAIVPPHACAWCVGMR